MTRLFSSVHCMGLIGAAVLSLASTTAFGAGKWDGAYAYERTFTNSKGERAGEIYSLNLGPGKACRITMTGPEGHEDIICRSAGSEKSVTVHFSRFADPKAAKANNARAYKKDQRLLTLERDISEKRPKAIRTIWHNLRTMDGKKPGSAAFKKA
jgi:hypothetical protein